MYLVRPGQTFTCSAVAVPCSAPARIEIASFRLPSLELGVNGRIGVTLICMRGDDPKVLFYASGNELASHGTLAWPADRVAAGQGNVGDTGGLESVIESRDE